jgi:hypothetical protein
MHVANRNKSVSSHNTIPSRWPDDDPRRSPSYSIPWLLACLRRWARVSACSLLTAATPTGRSLGSDLSRGAGDYTPRDKPICAIRVSPVCPHTSHSEARDEYGFSFVRRLRTTSQSQKMDALPGLYQLLFITPLSLGTGLLLGLVTFSRVLPLTVIRVPSDCTIFTDKSS